MCMLLWRIPFPPNAYDRPLCKLSWQWVKHCQLLLSFFFSSHFPFPIFFFNPPLVKWRRWNWEQWMLGLWFFFYYISPAPTRIYLLSLYLSCPTHILRCPQLHFTSKQTYLSPSSLPVHRIKLVEGMQAKTLIQPRSENSPSNTFYILNKY